MDRYDQMEGYCRMLGHYIPFKYCRTQQNGLPCGKIMDCFFERIPIQEFIETHYSEEERGLIFGESTPKMQTILEMIEKARSRSATQ